MWLAWFVALETLAVLDRRTGDTLTEHVRPLFHAHPLLWILAIGFLVWLFIHFIVPDVERWIRGLL